jgi:hypothetical protein
MTFIAVFEILPAKMFLGFVVRIWTLTESYSNNVCLWSKNYLIISEVESGYTKPFLSYDYKMYYLKTDYRIIFQRDTVQLFQIQASMIQILLEIQIL